MHPLFRTWGLVVTAVAGSTVGALWVYAAVQQGYRTGANDPQIQWADDATAALRAGVTPSAALPPGRVDLARGLAPWMTVVDASNHVLASSMSLDGRALVPPAGSLDVARAAGENRVTWMPRRDVRQAIVARAVGDGRVVIVGRSLREVEERELRLRIMTGLAWGALLVASLLFAGFAAASPRAGPAPAPRAA